ncbi:DnaJ-domain-containing protein [Panus rudis PR-1116 ss-1]|nr:DnaJ-domain-containing protein [Panus rudis PR-1116 ss-1]
MSETPPDGNNTPNPDDVEYLYTVLNLPKTASDHEIRDRYRQLSIAFHPDKQRDERKRAAATRHFYEIQKAYEVLSDPVRRQVYDTLGNEGLEALKGIEHDLQGLSPEQVKSVLAEYEQRNELRRVDTLISPRGHVTVGVDATSLFDDASDVADEPWYSGAVRRARSVRCMVLSVGHSVRKVITPSTSVHLNAEVTRNLAMPGAGSVFVGTIRHQFSPRLYGEVSARPLGGPMVSVKGRYVHDDYTASAELTNIPFLLRVFSRIYAQPDIASQVLPFGIPVRLTFTRRLFPGSNAQGVLAISTAGKQPKLQLSYVSDSTAFNWEAEDDSMRRHAEVPAARVLRAPSRTGLTGVRFWRVGTVMNGLLPAVNAEYVVTLPELKARARSMVQIGLTGLTAALGAFWSEDDNSAGADVEFSLGGIVLKLEFSVLHQSFNLPIVLSPELDVRLAFWTTLVPSTAFVLAYHFLYKPRSRKRRLEYFRQARRELKEAKSEVLRQHEESIYLLQDLAKRHMEAEAASDGLVITEAWYGPSDRSDNTCEGLDIDVTIPLQALVNKGQLYIPGRRSKTGLQGFYDPIPGILKTLRIRYTFRGREHYVEIPDYMPVVLPLEEHLVR